MDFATPEFSELAELSERWRNPWRDWDTTNRNEYISVSKRQPWYVGSEEGEDPKAHARRFWESALWHQMVGPEFQGFLNACRKAVSDTNGTAMLDEWRGETSPLNDICRNIGPMATDLRDLFDLFLECAQAVGPWTWVNDQPNEEAFRRFVKSAVSRCDRHQSRLLQGLPENFWIDLRDALLHSQGKMRAGSGEASVGVLLVDANNAGRMATLVFELVPTNADQGQLYPAPSVALVWRDQDFIGGEQNAQSVVRAMKERGACGGTSTAPTPAISCSPPGPSSARARSSPACSGRVASRSPAISSSEARGTGMSPT
jgi:hypothetical protein